MSDSKHQDYCKAAIQNDNHRAVDDYCRAIDELSNGPLASWTPKQIRDLTARLQKEQLDAGESIESSDDKSVYNILEMTRDMDNETLRKLSDMLMCASYCRGLSREELNRQMAELQEKCITN